jgi:hypothetical protein
MMTIGVKDTLVWNTGTGKATAALIVGGATVADEENVTVGMVTTA